MIVFDEFPSTSLLAKNRRIDSVRYPSFAALARDATWYRNATTVHDSTFASVPSILDGRPPVYAQGHARHPHAHTLMGLLAKHGYRIHASVEANGVCSPHWCGPPKPTRYWLVRSRSARFSDWAASIQPSDRPALWLKHTLLPHLPWIYLPSGKQYVRGARTPVAGINSARGVFDRYLVRLAYQRHLLQVGAVDRLLGRVLARLKATGLYDRALIVVTADHGVSFRLGEEDRRIVTPANLPSIAPVPLFVKRPRQRHGRISRVYARTVDIVPTIADVLGDRVPWPTAGRSLFGRDVRGRHTVRVVGRSGATPVVKSGVRRFSARVGRSIRYQHAVFGYGRRGPGLYGIGPARRLRGRAVASLRAAGRGRLSAHLVKPQELAHVKLASRFRPSLVAGTLSGGRRGATRTVAVAVNGRVAATGSTFVLRGTRTERFAVLVPEWVFHEGRNSVELYAVASRHRHLHVRLLGAV
jgi:hypothetical protein